MARSEAEVEAMAAIFEKLEEMRLHDETGDPHDEGYMDAVSEMRLFLDAYRAEAVDELEKLRAEVVELDRANEGLGEEVVRLQRRAEAASQRDEITPEEAQALIAVIARSGDLPRDQWEAYERAYPKLRRLAQEDPS